MYRLVSSPHVVVVPACSPFLGSEIYRRVFPALNMTLLLWNLSRMISFESKCSSCPSGCPIIQASVLSPKHDLVTMESVQDDYFLSPHVVGVLVVVPACPPFLGSQIYRCVFPALLGRTFQERLEILLHKGGGGGQQHSSIT